MNRPRLGDNPVSPLAIGAVLGACCGLLALIGGLPSALKLLLLLAFVLAGPGCAVLSRLPVAGHPAVLALAPIIGLSVVALTTGLAAIGHALDSSVILATLAGVTLLCAAVRPARGPLAPAVATEPAAGES